MSEQSSLTQQSEQDELERIRDLPEYDEPVEFLAPLECTLRQLAATSSEAQGERAPHGQSNRVGPA